MKWNVSNLVLSVVLVAVAFLFRGKLLHLTISNAVAAADGGRHAFAMGTFSGIIIAVAILIVAVATKSFVQTTRHSGSGADKVDNLGEKGNQRKE